MRTWTDADGDTWYLAGKDEWTLWAPDSGQPDDIPNVPTDRMRNAFPDFPY